MDYLKLLAELNEKSLRQLAESREINCAYMEQGVSLEDNRDIIIKTLGRHLLDTENIRKALTKLTPGEIESLRRAVTEGTCPPSDRDKLQGLGFLFCTGDGEIVLPNEVTSALLNMEAETSHQVDVAETVSGLLGYASFIAIANGFLMKQLRCLNDLRPGKRMVECISEKLNRPVSADAFVFLYDFLLTSGLLLKDEETGRINIPDNLPTRGFFYTNLFKFLVSHFNAEWMEQLLTTARATGTGSVLDRTKFSIPELEWEILELSDFIKPMKGTGFVLTGLAIQFLKTKSAQPEENDRDSFFILPGFRVLVDRNIGDSILNQLIRITQMESYDQVFHFAFNSCSLIQARRQGIKESDLVEFVQKHAGECPTDLRLMIQDTYDRYGEVRIFSGYNILVSRTPHLNQKLSAIDEISRYSIFEDDRTLILQGSKNPLETKRLLVEQGLIPELFVSREFRQVHRNDMDDITGFLLMLDELLSKDGGAEHERLRALFEKLRISPDPEISSPKEPQTPTTSTGNTELDIEKKGTMSLEDLMEILQFAIGRNYRMKIRYKQKGRSFMEERIIVPKYFDGDFLVAFCEARNGERRFNLYRLELVGFIVEE